MEVRQAADAVGRGVMPVPGPRIVGAPASTSEFGEGRFLARPQQRHDVLHTTLDDEILIYGQDRMIAFALNQTAAVIWQLCDGERTVADIITMLQEAYPDQAATMPHEVDECLLDLLSHGVIRLPRA